MKHILALVTLTCLFSKTTSQTIFDALSQTSQEPSQLILTVDLKSFLRTIDEEPYFNANLSLPNSQGDTLAYNVKIRARGNSRKEICYPPPIRIKFKKKQLLANGLDTTSNIYKLVLQCKSPTGFSQMVLKEYLAYRIFNCLTPASFRVHLVRVVLIDENDPSRIYERDGFIIETEEQLVQRLEGSIREKPLKYADPLEDEHFLRFSLFQYLIGNTDWALGNNHNIKLVQRNKLGDVLLIPYDFDYSGFVNAPYAVPDERLPIQSVRQRFYKGMHPTDQQLQQEVAYWKEKMLMIKNVINNFELLSDRSRKSINNYIASFEKQINKPKKIRQITK